MHHPDVATAKWIKNQDVPLHNHMPISSRPKSFALSVMNNRLVGICSVTTPSYPLPITYCIQSILILLFRRMGDRGRHGDTSNMWVRRHNAHLWSARHTSYSHLNQLPDRTTIRFGQTCSLSLERDDAKPICRYVTFLDSAYVSMQSWMKSDSGAHQTSSLQTIGRQIDTPACCSTRQHWDAPGVKYYDPTNCGSLRLLCRRAIGAHMGRRQRSDVLICKLPPTTNFSNQFVEQDLAWKREEPAHFWPNSILNWSSFRCMIASRPFHLYLRSSSNPWKSFYLYEDTALSNINASSLNEPTLASQTNQTSTNSCWTHKQLVHPQVSRRDNTILGVVNNCLTACSKSSIYCIRPLRINLLEERVSKLRSWSS